MTLRNKKTGEIGYTAVLRSKAIVVMDENAIQLGSYTSLTELNEEWEDAPEEPKEYWYVEPNGVIARIDEWDCCTENDRKVMKLIGNYFETKEEAEKAVERLKAWKRMKKCGLRFWDLDKVHLKIGYIFENYTKEDIPQLKKDLALIFGGEE